MTRKALRIVVHDYSGHPGQVQLSRALTKRGHQVVHQHCPSYTTGKGALESLPGDPVGLTFQPCPLKSEFKRYSISRRVFQELRYGINAGRLIVNNAPDVAVISNVPLLAHGLVALRLRRNRIPMVFWQQDIYSSAIRTTAIRMFPKLGFVIAWTAERLERAIARSSDAIVAISATFLEKLDQWGVAEKTTVIPNWAPLDELPVLDRSNSWRESMGLMSAPVVLYSGTLGLKHDPSILALIAAHLKETHPGAFVVVVSEGRGREWLESWKRDHAAENLLLLDYQNYEDLPMMLASADVLVAILEPDASEYSVPSKVLTYLCAERAILGVMPHDNSMAQILWSNDAGIVADPCEPEKTVDVVGKLLNDPSHRRQLGKAARSYAEKTFRPDRAAAQFEEVFYRLRLIRPPESPSPSGDG